MKKNDIILVYPAIFNPEDTAYNVQFVDIPEAFTFGEGMVEAVLMAQDVLGVVLYETNDFPKPSDIKDIKVNDGDFVAMITLNLSEYRRTANVKIIRKNTSIPEWLNNLAEKENINFSQTLTEALKKKLGIR